MTTDRARSLPRYFYGGLEYDTADEMAAWLQSQPPHRSGDYIKSMERFAYTHATAGDYRGMRGVYNMLVDVLIALAKLEGRRYLE